MHSLPPPSIPHRTKKNQHGAALMVILVIVVLGIIAALVSSLSSSALKSARQERTAAALAQAKDALIGYAITYGDTHSGEVHGYLPCPDIDGKDLNNNPAEGRSELNCGGKNISFIGRLPWSTLDLPTLRDGDGECLWYAVAGTYKYNPKTDLMNWDNNGQFEILNASGVTVAQNVAAVIFAPGIALETQNRAPDGSAPICGGNYTAANYLDSDGMINNAVVSSVAKAISQFRLDSSSQINDHIIYITQQDIWNAIQKRTDFQNTLQLLTQRVAECLKSYGNNNNDGSNKSLPWPAPLALADYGVNNNYDDTQNIYAGRIPYRVGTSKQTTNNNMTGSPAYPLMATSNGLTCPGYAANPSTELQRLYPWWDNWKDHLFYAIAKKFEPSLNTNQSCGTCLTITGSASKYAAVVMFAGQKLSALNQTRADKSAVANYLEVVNASNVAAANPPTDGNENYQASAVSSTFNDILYCIKEDLSVSACP